MFELSNISKGIEINPLFDIRYLLIWNKRPERFGDKEDELFYPDRMHYDKEKGIWHYSGNVLKMIKTSSPGVPYLPIENQFIDVPENELKSRSSYLSLIGRAD